MQRRYLLNFAEVVNWNLAVTPLRAVGVRTRTGRISLGEMGDWDSGGFFGQKGFQRILSGE